jgi:hypothetical protein
MGFGRTNRKAVQGGGEKKVWAEIWRLWAGIGVLYMVKIGPLDVSGAMVNRELLSGASRSTQ